MDYYGETAKIAAISGAVGGGVAGVVAGIIIGIFIVCCLKQKDKDNKVDHNIYTDRRY